MRKKNLKYLGIFSMIGILIMGAIPVNVSGIDVYIVSGYVYEEIDGDLYPIENIDILLTNVYKGDHVTVSTNADGFYWYDMASLEHGVDVGDVISRQIEDLSDDIIIYKESNVLPNTNSDPYDLVMQYLDTSANYKVTYNMDYKKNRKLTVQDVTLKTDIYGRVYYVGKYKFKDDYPGQKTADWSETAYKLKERWNGQGSPKQDYQIGTQTNIYPYTGPQSWINFADIILIYNPDESVGSTLYTQQYGAIHVSDSTYNINAEINNIVVSVTNP